MRSVWVVEFYDPDDKVWEPDGRGRKVDAYRSRTHADADVVARGDDGVTYRVVEYLRTEE